MKEFDRWVLERVIDPAVSWLYQKTDRDNFCVSDVMLCLFYLFLGVFLISIPVSTSKQTMIVLITTLVVALSSLPTRYFLRSRIQKAKKSMLDGFQNQFRNDWRKRMMLTIYASMTLFFGVILVVNYGFKDYIVYMITSITCALLTFYTLAGNCHCDGTKKSCPAKNSLTSPA